MRLVAKAILYRDASLDSAETSFWCPCTMRLSQKKISMSIFRSAIMAPICWSPPRGPDKSLVTLSLKGKYSVPSFSNDSSLISLPVVPVANRLCFESIAALNFTQERSSSFLPSCATSAMFNFFIFRKINPVPVSLSLSCTGFSCCKFHA